ncbi:hypothetical protein P280DRAFT_412847 [Massarina eburnea CBS 473.64]|uniref:Uncharacterized protein n=1 Tax=Massarina eburnea CBS 473.64 TaxID=1395130 RepID=A0A6A6RHW8_9PLEO|nr:hypothetical protein P280DRAFT_412847 [Massarina eburnea CBS 473.64]
MQNPGPGRGRGRGGGRGGGGGDRGRPRGRPNRQRGRGDYNQSPSSSSSNTTTPSETRPPPRTNFRPNTQTFKPRQESHSVPNRASISPGKAVAIVLKQDQPTGHEVRGIVADVLTKGDHPRGVKVRLRDGRVGRVQRHCTAEEGENGERIVGGAGAGLGRDGEGGGGGGSRGGGWRHEKDIRDQDEYLYDEERVLGSRSAVGGGLFAALEEADKRHEEVVVGQRLPGGADEVANCPVCGDFEGDEVAVARHVEGHFGG